ncbi:hypothetical protein EKL30_03895 [Candidimonas sp. SYP-B2681]|uniref:cupredoxin domain-containing protein n=1 Tax=Candidimonas sp. SYP-B2681 TaxID=2497686 RepID=UPI000F885B9C|nr:cupredoxin family protein [Candidimonas sp. SYP-B2681]RTZ48107.1 hypothetical protein EKL30_03895 [Candidimonas sp. SYP-B2681]
MNKVLSILLLGLCSPLVFADSGHRAGHDVQGKDPAITSMSSSEDPGHPRKVTRTIEVLMDDTMRFMPSDISVKVGETVQFSVRNVGRITHEMVIGSVSELMAHAAEMRKSPGMIHMETNMISLAPGHRGTLVWRFDKTGAVDFACLIPGHLEAGMVGRVIVG